METQLDISTASKLFFTLCATKRMQLDRNNGQLYLFIVVQASLSVIRIPT